MTAAADARTHLHATLSLAPRFDSTKYWSHEGPLMSDDEHEDGGGGRVTAPMQEYTGTDVIVGLVVMVVGIFLVAGLPYIF